MCHWTVKFTCRSVRVGYFRTKIIIIVSAKKILTKPRNEKRNIDAGGGGRSPACYCYSWPYNTTVYSISHALILFQWTLHLLMGTKYSLRAYSLVLLSFRHSLSTPQSSYILLLYFTLLIE